jgi:hypothetical protein
LIVSATRVAPTDASVAATRGFVGVTDGRMIETAPSVSHVGDRMVEMSERIAMTRASTA